MIFVIVMLSLYQFPATSVAVADAVPSIVPVTTFTLLCDVDKEAAGAYGVYKEKNMYGRKVMGIVRTTFVIGEDGRIAKIFANVKAKGHAEQVLGAL